MQPRIRLLQRRAVHFLVLIGWQAGVCRKEALMEYEGRICRGPMEAKAFMLPVTVGCPYNRCKFCDLFTDLKYRKISMEDIENELKRVSALGGNPSLIYLGDGNAFQLSTDELMEIIALVKRYFSNAHSFNSDATITSIKSKSDKELKTLHSLGYNKLYIGIENALPDVLAFMNKDHDVDEAYREIARIQEAGFSYAAHFMTGIAGSGRWEESAVAMAEFLTETKPENVVNFSMFLSADKLSEEIRNGNFKPATELENLKEERKLVELLDVDPNHPIKWDSFHDWIHVRTRGSLPKDKDKILAVLDKAIAKFEKLPDIYSMKMGTPENDDGYGFLGQESPSLKDVYIAPGAV